MIRWFTTYRFRCRPSRTQHLAVPKPLVFGVVSFGKGQGLSRLVHWLRLIPAKLAPSLAGPNTHDCYGTDIGDAQDADGESYSRAILCFSVNLILPTMPSAKA